MYYFRLCFMFLFFVLTHVMFSNAFSEKSLKPIKNKCDYNRLMQELRCKVNNKNYAYLYSCNIDRFPINIMERPRFLRIEDGFHDLLFKNEFFEIFLTKNFENHASIDFTDDMIKIAKNIARRYTKHNIYIKSRIMLNELLLYKRYSSVDHTPIRLFKDVMTTNDLFCKVKNKNSIIFPCLIIDLVENQINYVLLLKRGNLQNKSKSNTRPTKMENKIYIHNFLYNSLNTGDYIINRKNIEKCRASYDISCYNNEMLYNNAGTLKNTEFEIKFKKPDATKKCQIQIFKPDLTIELNDFDANKFDTEMIVQNNNKNRIICANLYNEGQKKVEINLNKGNSSLEMKQKNYEYFIDGIEQEEDENK